MFILEEIYARSLTKEEARIVKYKISTLYFINYFVIIFFFTDMHKHFVYTL